MLTICKYNPRRNKCSIEKLFEDINLQFADCKTAEGGYDNPVFDPNDPSLDDRNPNHDDGDDGDQDPDVTNPFVPGPAFTPGPSGGEDIPMQTMKDEKSGLPDTPNTEDSNLLSAREKNKQSLECCRKSYFQT